jgi:ABC-type protease/lipase transport system fused ATPase/permease subunit
MIFTEQKGQIVKDLDQVRLTLPKIEHFKTGDLPMFPWFLSIFIPYGPMS